MTNLEVLVFVAESHGNHLATMFPTPGIYMGILQQIVAHLTFVSCKYHRAALVISKYFFSTKTEISFSRFSSRN